MSSDHTPRPTPPSRRRSPLRRPVSPLWIGALLFGLLLAAQVTTSYFQQGESLDYSQFKSLLAQGQVLELQLSQEFVDVRIHGLNPTSNASSRHFQ